MQRLLKILVSKNRISFNCNVLSLNVLVFYIYIFFAAFQMAALCPHFFSHPFSSDGKTIDTDFLGPLWGTSLSSGLTNFSSSGIWTRAGLA